MEEKKKSRSFLVRIKKESSEKMAQLSFEDLSKIMKELQVSKNDILTWKSSLLNSHYLSIECKKSLETFLSDEIKASEESNYVLNHDKGIIEDFDLSEFKRTHRRTIINVRNYFIEREINLVKQKDWKDFIENFSDALTEEIQMGIIRFFVDGGVFSKTVKPINIGKDKVDDVVESRNKKLTNDKAKLLLNVMEALVNLHRKSDEDFFTLEDVDIKIREIISKDKYYATINEDDIAEWLENKKFVSSLKRAGIIRYGEEAQNVGESCPMCGKSLVVRIAKRTGKKFIGCSAFPMCRYIESKEKTQELLLNIESGVEAKVENSLESESKNGHNFEDQLMISQLINLIKNKFEIAGSQNEELVLLTNGILEIKKLLGGVLFADISRLISNMNLNIEDEILEFIFEELDIKETPEINTIYEEKKSKYDSEYVNDIVMHILSNVSEIYDGYEEIDDEVVLINTLNYHDEIVEAGASFCDVLEEVKTKAYEKHKGIKVVKIKIIDAIINIMSYLDYKTLTPEDAISLLDNYGFDYLKDKPVSSLRRTLNAHSLETFGNEKSYSNNNNRYFWKPSSKTHTLINRDVFLNNIEGLSDKQIKEYIEELVESMKVIIH